jgi:hypothetical protein
MAKFHIFFIQKIGIDLPIIIIGDKYYQIHKELTSF